MLAESFINTRHKKQDKMNILRRLLPTRTTEIVADDPGNILERIMRVIFADSRTSQELNVATMMETQLTSADASSAQEREVPR